MIAAIPGRARALVEECLPVIWSAGELVRAKAGAGRLGFSTKSSDSDLVTEVDRLIEAFLIGRLTAVLPDALVMSEEGDGPADGVAGLTWVIDPIDGTTNLVHGVPYVAISVALVSRDRVEMGIVHNPFTMETHFSVADGGAHRAGTLDSGRAESVQVSSVKELSGSLVGFGFPSDRHYTAATLQAADRIVAGCQDLRRQGSSALDLVAVACGQLDGYFELDLRPWDLAAGSLILEEAGGRITTWDGDRVHVHARDQRIDVVASNGLVHDEMIAALSR